MSERAKDKAREKHRYHNVEHDWWDWTYEDIIRVAELLGVSITHTVHVGRAGREYTTADIWFSGFGSQGDGLSYSAEYKVASDACKAIQGYAPEDGELHRIAKELTAAQLASRLKGNGTYEATVKGGGRYLALDINIVDYRGDDDNVSDEAAAIEQALRDFADWMYDRLEQEHDWLTSDECIDERLRGEIFDVDGNVV